jgi:oxygen-independent coproporphyrinogen-3 oxidase
MAPQQEYLGFGNGAYSFANGHVYCNDARLDAYLDLITEGRDPIAFSRKVSTLELMSRYFVLGLKFFDVPRTPFIRLYGMTPEEVFGAQLQSLQDSGHLLRAGDGYRLTASGRRYVNNVCKEFYIGDNIGRRQQVQFVPTLTATQILAYGRRAGLDQVDAT